MHPFIERLIISFVLLLICFPVLTSQAFIVWPWYGREWTGGLLALLLPFNVLALMLLWNYYLCVVTDPGRVPTGWEPDTSSVDGYEVKKLTGGPRYCRTCENFKPPRSHHCRQCNRCILRMDHHCPWINNCVGHFNHGHFIRFLFYVDLTCSYHLSMVTRRVLDTLGRRYYDDPSSLELIFIIMNYVFCVPVLLAVGAFSLYHFHGLLNNTTTIEGWEKDKAAMLKRRGKFQEVKFPYNLGAWRNVTSVLGDNPLLWCWPAIPPGTGLKYQLSMGDGTNTQHSWPPRDPTLQDQQPFQLPDSPWTYGNDDINPNLRPSNAHLRTSNGLTYNRVYASALPPYHPDFERDFDAPSARSHPPDFSEEYPGRGYGSVRVRRGSEGYEVRPLDREMILMEHIRSQVAEEGRYQVYDGKQDSESEDLLPDEDVPLGSQN
ncbi:DHHC palmitoyltransferase-domain-containing protein [Phlebopus sp. FC_14]|nr:DHHC palmitoyltransferase-domain-containing protein [Phlebopus sp. FC_14]